MYIIFIKAIDLSSAKSKLKSMNFLRNKYDTVENVIILYTVSPTTECLLSTIFLSFYKYLIIGCVIPTAVDGHLIKYVFLNIRNNLLPYLLSKYYYYLFQIRIDWKLKNTHILIKY